MRSSVDRTRALPADVAAVGARHLASPLRRTIGRYAIGEPLGAGGMGVVYRARDPRLERDVAVKVIRSDAASSERARARFVREARAMARVTHPNVVEVYDVGVADGCPYLVMELVEGTTLAGWLAGGRRSESEILGRVLAAARGLIAAHDAGLIHRDFKPSNVLIGDDGRVLVSDFGLARSGGELEAGPPTLSDPSDPAVEPTSDAITETGMVLGSPVYMAPEQHLDRGVPIDAGVDQYAFAVTLYEALTGKRPFQGSTDLALLLAKRRGPPSWIGDSPWWRLHGPALLRALEPDPARRWPSLRRLVAQLGPRRRPWWKVGVVAVGLGVGLGGSALGLRADASIETAADRCRVEGERLAVVWNDGQRNRVRAAIAASQRAHAQQTGVRVIDQLDAEATAWISVHAEVCGEPATEPDTRLACLGAQLDQLSLKVGRLRVPGPATADDAVTIATSGRPVAACLEHSEDLLAGLAPEQREVATEIQAALEDVRAGQLVRRPQELEAATAEVLDRARALGHAYLETEALLLRGGTLASLGRVDEGVGLLEEAEGVAEANGRWRQAANAQIESVYVEGCGRGDGRAATRSSRQAEASLARVAPNPQARVSLLNNLGAAHQCVGQFDAACRVMEEGLALVEASADAYPNELGWRVALATNYQNRSLCRGDAAPPSERVHYLGRAFEQFEAVLGPQHPRTASVEYSLATALAAEGRVETAVVHFEHALAVNRGIVPAGDVWIAEQMGDLGLTLARGGHHQRAATTLHEAVTSMVEAPSARPEVVLALRAVLAAQWSELGEIDRAVGEADSVRAQVMETIPADHVIRVVVLQSTARVAMAAGRPEQGLHDEGYGLPGGL
ncbi:MAG: serine/threonine-protein kinase, partial [Deltaproteobacteria bacterium]|nr:serine/threonine-protein kinase [Deltaproteobacteria bacterium]